MFPEKGDIEVVVPDPTLYKVTEIELEESEGVTVKNL